MYSRKVNQPTHEKKLTTQTRKTAPSMRIIPYKSVLNTFSCGGGTAGIGATTSSAFVWKSVTASGAGGGVSSTSSGVSLAKRQETMQVAIMQNMAKMKATRRLAHATSQPAVTCDGNHTAHFCWPRCANQDDQKCKKSMKWVNAPPVR